MVLMMEETPSNENSEVHSITPPPNDATPIAVAVAVADADADANVMLITITTKTRLSYCRLLLWLFYMMSHI